ncbi:MAG TPA: hypothetical protein VNL92_02810 [Dehalococcoidia bacterium]|nr:hypothetical protein [Dehalococcoidia bacterium]
MASMTSRARRASVYGLAALGALQVYRKAFYGMTRRRVIRLERPVNYDPDLLYPEPLGKPIYLVKPENDTTLLFLSGFRTLTMPGQHLDWFRELHEQHGINILAPVFGIQSLPFDQRMVGTTVERDVREVMQVLDAYRSTLPADHRIVCSCISYGAIPSLAIAAMRDVSDFILTGPAPIITPPGPTTRTPSIVRRLKNPVLRPIAASLLKRLHNPESKGMRLTLAIAGQLVPTMARRRLESGWDIEHEERRQYAYDNLPLPADVPLADAKSMLTGIALTRESYLPRITGKRFLIAWGELDSLVTPEQNEALADELEQLGNEVIRRGYENSGHLVLMDGELEQVQDDILEFIRPGASLFAKSKPAAPEVAEPAPRRAKAPTAAAAAKASARSNGAQT